MRADARDNRDRILAAAREAFADDGDVSMNQVARRAGVGAGTLYRNYPTREALVLAVYRQEVEQLVEAVPALLAEQPPLDALRSWTVDLVDAMRRKHGLGDALSATAHQAMAEQSYGPVIGAITALLEAGQREGVVRADADPRDFLQLTGALWRAASGPEDRSPQMLELILDGLTARP
ncbi:TetR/AcrR family transcriptional regulator [Nocardioides mangrovi]|uniref:TetR/AcrR family transcriptional regulator n=1 Tax=Nocardioides mangrovi TaxID=2874580 RepID=A0ABS7U7A8_9ACTN|nr:TetR/AcrR family transcriptional regulator [Nocardioides mangrovi]MBZ5736618.1 TetR/AcrR family transcriptional regulator [Nocardioides mangrovi]